MKYKQLVKDDITKVVLLSDVHLGIRNASIEWMQNIINYFNDFFIPYLKRFTEKDKVLLIFAGDFFDNRQTIDINILNIGADIIEKISEIVEVYMLLGNHDIYKKKDLNITSLRIFKYFKNVKVIDNITELSIKSKKFILIPWQGDTKEESKILSKSSADIAILHSDISGLIYDNGRSILDGVNTSGFLGTKIYSGHIHKAQSSDKVTYLGSPYQLRRSDIGNNKGFYTLDFISDDKIIESYYPNTYSPSFVRIKLIDILEKTYPEIKELIENKYVDILVHKDYMKEINVAKLMTVFDQCEPRKIEILTDKSDLFLFSEYPDDEHNHTSDLSVTDIFKTMITNYNLNDDNIKRIQILNKNYLQMATNNLDSNE